MKRACGEQEDPDTFKRQKKELLFHRALQDVKALSAGAWRAAKHAVLHDACRIVGVDETSEILTLHGVVHIAPGSPTAQHAHHTPAPSGHVSVEVALDTNSGEILDCRSSCCPGGFHVVLGSFCPCVGALLVHSGAVHRSPGGLQAHTAASGSQQQKVVPFPSWEGSSLQQAVKLKAFKHSMLRLVEQRAAPRPPLPGGAEWAADKDMALGVKLNSRRTGFEYDRYYGARPVTNVGGVDRAPSNVEDAVDDLPNDPTFKNAESTALVLRPLSAVRSAAASTGDDSRGTSTAGAGSEGGVAGLSAALMREGAALRENVKAAATAAAAARSGSGEGSQKPLEEVVQHFATEGLLLYNGGVVRGWLVRPKVINTAFELLTGSAATPEAGSGAPADAALGGVQRWSSSPPARGPGDPDPLAAVVVLMRGLWEYMHVHALCRKLSKPFKMACALRNVLLVADVPMYARRAVVGLLGRWERALMRQHAETPLEVWAAPGLVHLFRVLQEARQLALHGWDYPPLLAMLEAPSSGAATPGAEGCGIGDGDLGQGGDEDDKGDDDEDEATARDSKNNRLEHKSLLKLRLALLDLHGLDDAYLQLAMRGHMWSEVVGRLLASKDRSKLQAAVRLLPQHIKSLPKRVAYVRRLVESQWLPGAERLDLAARLLLDMRSELQLSNREVRVSPSTASADTQRWTVAAYTVRLDPQPGESPQDLSVRTSTHNRELWRALQEMSSAFMRAAATSLLGGAREARDAMMAALKEQDPRVAEELDRAAAEKEQERAAADKEAEAARTQEAETIRFRAPCPDCGGYHSEDEYYEPHSMPVWANRTPPSKPPVPLLELDEAMFEGRGAVPFVSHQGPGGPRDASPSPTGFIEDQALVEGYQRVFPVEYPDQTALCSLAGRAVHVLAASAMGQFEAGGAPDPAAPAEPLGALMSHPYVEMGGVMARLQAALEVMVRVMCMTPLAPISADQLDSYYSNLTWQLVAMGQRDLALLAARCRYRYAPSKRAAGELMEVAVVAGPEAQAAAVDLLLSKVARQPQQQGVNGEGEGAEPGTPPRQEGDAMEVDVAVAGAGQDEQHWRSGSRSRSHSPAGLADDESIDTQRLMDAAVRWRSKTFDDDLEGSSDTAASRLRRVVRRSSAAAQAAAQAAAAGPGDAAAGPGAAGAPAAGGNGRGAAAVVDAGEGLMERLGPQMAERLRAYEDDIIEELDAFRGFADLVDAREQAIEALEADFPDVLDGVPHHAIEEWIHADEDGPIMDDPAAIGLVEVDPVLQRVLGLRGLARRDRAEGGAEAAGGAGAAAGPAGGAGQEAPGDEDAGGAALLDNADLRTVVEDLFGTADGRWLRQSHQLPSELLWCTAQYAKGRGADPAQVQRLAIAAWCGGWAQLRRRPVASSWETWQLPSYWPASLKDTTPAAGRLQRAKWRGLPAANWPSFEAQDRTSYVYDYSVQWNDPEAMLAWLLVVTDDATRTAGGGSSAGGSSVSGGSSRNSGACGSGGCVEEAAGPNSSGAPRACGSTSRSGIGGVAGSLWQRQAPLLRKLALLTQHTRYGPPLIQLAYALHKAGEHDMACHLLSRALPPAGLSFDMLCDLRPWHLAALKELLPLAAKRGSDELRRAASVARLLILRLPLDVSDVADEGVVRYLIKDVVLKLYSGYFPGRHMDLRFEEMATQPTPVVDPYTGYGATSADASRSRAARMLYFWIKDCMMRPAAGLEDNPLFEPPPSGLAGQGLPPRPSASRPSSGGATRKSRDGSMDGDEGPAATTAQQQQHQRRRRQAEAATVRRRFIGALVDATESASWSVRLCLARLARSARLDGGQLTSLGPLLCPALNAAVQEFEREAGEAYRPPQDMDAWRISHTAQGNDPQQLNPSAQTARSWVEATLKWLEPELVSNFDEVSKQCAAADADERTLQDGAQPRDGMTTQQVMDSIAAARERRSHLAEFLEELLVTLQGWSGPELLPLLRRCLREMGPELFPEALNLLPRAVLPLAGRRGVVQHTKAWQDVAYAEALHWLLNDAEFKSLASCELLRCIAITYWIREGTPQALLKANEALLAEEGSDSAQLVHLPDAPYSSSGEGTAGGALGALAGIPRMHPSLVAALDLVETKGGLDAAYFKFLQLQRAVAAAAELRQSLLPAMEAVQAEARAAILEGLAAQTELVDLLKRQQENQDLAAQQQQQQEERPASQGGRGKGRGKGGRGGRGRSKGSAAAEPAAAVQGPDAADTAAIKSAEARVMAAFQRKTAAEAQLPAAMAPLAAVSLALTEALCGVFSRESGAAAPGAQLGRLPSELSGLMGQVDLVLQFVSRHKEDDTMRALTDDPIFQAFTIAVDSTTLTPNTAPAIFDALPEPLRPHALMLKLWRVAGAIVRGPVPLETRVRLVPLRQRPAGGVALTGALFHPSYAHMGASWQSTFTAAQLQDMADQLKAPEQVRLVDDRKQPLQFATQLHPQFARLVYSMEEQERLLAWLVVTYSKSIPSIQVLPDLTSLLPCHSELGKMPVLMDKLGAAVKEDRVHAWPAYRAFRILFAPTKIGRWLRRNAGQTEGGLTTYLCKSTIVEIQNAKADCLPWLEWTYGSKASQAAELASWLWWLHTFPESGGLLLDNMRHYF